jgi:hypothetical protein
MSNEDKKTINIEASVVVKKSQDFKQISHKANAGISEADAIERHTVGDFEDNGQEKEEQA